MCEELKKTVEKAWDNRELLGDERVKQARWSFTTN